MVLKRMYCSDNIRIEEEEFLKYLRIREFLPRSIADVFTREFEEKYLEGLTDTTKEIVMKTNR